MAEIIIKVDLVLYSRYAVMEQIQLVIYAALSKALYGTICDSLLFWWKLNYKLIECGYKINPYDWYVANKLSRAVNVQYCIMLLISKYQTYPRRCWKSRLIIID